MSNFAIVHPHSDLNFDSENGHLYIWDSGTASIDLTKVEAINLASKLLQWGTSS